MIYLITLGMGILIWWIVFGIECVFTGAKPSVTMPFKEAYEELKYNLPYVGPKYRMQYANNDPNLASMLPGWLHFCIMHILVPLLPTLIKLALELIVSHYQGAA